MKVLIPLFLAFFAMLPFGLIAQNPVGAYAEVKDGELWLRGFVALPDGSRIARAERRGPLDAPEALGLALADDLRADGADDILASL